VPGVDYFDTFAPVAKLASIRTILAIAAELDLELHQIDIKGAYLNGELTDEEQIYMRQPPGYEIPGLAQKACHLLKTLYGLKQSGRRWYQKLVDILVGKLKFECCSVDEAVFFCKVGDELMVILVHVDDCTIASNSLDAIVKFKQGIQNHVEISDMGELHWLLGLEIKRNRQLRTLSISQRAYIDSRKSSLGRCSTLFSIP